LSIFIKGDVITSLLQLLHLPHLAGHHWQCRNV
jgi:hypothetical protein